MPPVEPLAKTCVRFNEPGHAHALTFSCAGRRPLFVSQRACELFVEGLAAARLSQEFDLWAYVVMPEHVHLLIRPRRRPYEISSILAAIKRPVAFWANREGISADSAFWLPGGGFDRNLDNAEAVHAEVEYMHGNPVRRGLCRNTTDWRYSSARFWAGLDDVAIEMDRTLPQRNQ
jgi:putative transposase